MREFYWFLHGLLFGFGFMTSAFLVQCVLNFFMG